jgi:triacylglycerol lipase
VLIPGKAWYFINGISYGDIIDLKWEDYRGFDMVEIYVNMVADLKGRGL